MIDDLDDPSRGLRRRPSARVLLLDPTGRVLMFRFAFPRGPLAGTTYWALPGGAVEAGESYEEAARRELAEETGLAVDAVGPEVGRREFVLTLFEGERVWAEERYFAVGIAGLALSDAAWTPVEREVIVETRWRSAEELAAETLTVYPEGLLEMLRTAAAGPRR